MALVSCGLRGGRRGAFALALLLCGLAVAFPGPAQAFELFGYRLWGEDPEVKAGIVDPVAYEPNLVLTISDKNLADDLRSSSVLFTQKALPPSGTVGLIQRARDDETNLIGLLYEKGYFGAVVSIVLGGRKLEDIGVTDTLGAPGSIVPVTITVEPGPSFTFGTVNLRRGDGPEAQAKAAEIGLQRGAPASSITIAKAAQAIVRIWERSGHPFAKVSGQEVIADHRSRTVDVTLDIDPGPSALIGEVRVTGTDQLEPDFVLHEADIPENVPYDIRILERARTNLALVDAIGSVTVRPAETLSADGRVPIIIEVSERKRRTIGAGVFYSSLDGAGGEFFWVHRNLFGEGEMLRFDAEIGSLFNVDPPTAYDEYDGRISILFDKPGVFGPRSHWRSQLTAIQEDPDPYFRRGVVAETALVYQLTEHLNLSAGLTLDWSRIDDGFGRNFYTLLSTPLIGTYDTRDNPLDATKGIYARILAEPQVELNHSAIYFTGDSELRTYFALDADDRFILAARGRVGSTAGAELEDIPAHKRFYAGGAGSVRGYEFLDIGPRIEGYGPTGGLARVEGSLEARIRVTDTIGIVPFADAGYVTETPLFQGNEELRGSVGIGARYYTSIGPLRLDFAVPLNRHKNDPNWALYFGIGQSF